MHSAPHSHGQGDSVGPDLLSQMGYETRDVNLQALSIWLGVLAVFIGFATIGTWFLYKQLVIDNTSQGNESVKYAHVVPPFPQLQPDPKRDMMDYRNAEDNVLSGKGSGTTAQPARSIDQAMETLATQQGISGVTGNTVSGVSDPGMMNPDSKAYPGGGDYHIPGGTAAGSANGTTP